MKLRSSELAWNEVEGEVVVLDLSSSLYLTVNGTGALLWRRLAEGATEAELVQILVEEAGAPPADAPADVKAFLDVLREKALLVGA